MCDIVPGRLILCFPKIDIAARGLVDEIRSGGIEHVHYVESMADKLDRIGIEDYHDLWCELHLVEVPSGSEWWKATYLQHFYKISLIQEIGKGSVEESYWEAIRWSDKHFTVTPNHILSVAAPRRGVRIRARDFSFNPVYANYRAMIRTGTNGARGDGVKVAVLDSGLAQDFPGYIAERRSFIGQQTEDAHGHGTVMTLIIHDNAPDAHFHAYQVFGADGRASEWDALAALVATRGMDVVNMSLQFGLNDKVCRICGRESESSRSAVFENVVMDVLRGSPHLIIVAAAGNWSRPQLTFPARIDGVVAVGAITSQYELSSESNYGNHGQSGKRHDSFFVLPGGEPARGDRESVGSFGADDRLWHGTSVATAIGSGIIARLVGTEKPAQSARSHILQKLFENVDRESFKSFNEFRYGRGIMRLPTS